MTETQKPSPGALRAADKILEAIEGTRSREVKELRPATVKILAKVIDREMNAEPRSAGASDLSETVNRDLLAVLKEIFYLLTYDEETTIEELYLMIYNVRKRCLSTIRETTGEAMPLKKSQSAKAKEE